MSDFVQTMKIVSILAHTFAPLSVIGALWNIRDVLRDKKRRESVYHRLVLGNSTGELLVAIWLSLSSLPMPKGSFYGARGNQATCDAQGFFLQLSVMSPLYTACITIYYLLMTRYRYRKEDLRKLERWVHPIIWIFGLATAAAGIPLKLYNPKGTWCWIASLPRMCEDNPDVECLRGDQAKYYLIGFAFGWIWLGVLITLSCLTMLYTTVHQSEVRTAKYDFARRVQAQAKSRGETSRRNSAPSNFFATKRRPSVIEQRRSGSSRHVASLAAGYVCAFLITMVPVTICITLFPKVAAIGPRAGLSLISVTFSLQGFFTFLVYHRPAIEDYFEKKKRKREIKSLRSARTSSSSTSSLIAWVRKRLSSSDITSSFNMSETSRRFSSPAAPIYSGGDECGNAVRDDADVYCEPQQHV